MTQKRINIQINNNEKVNIPNDIQDQCREWEVTKTIKDKDKFGILYNP